MGEMLFMDSICLLSFYRKHFRFAFFLFYSCAYFHSRTTKKHLKRLVIDFRALFTCKTERESEKKTWADGEMASSCNEKMSIIFGEKGHDLMLKCNTINSSLGEFFGIVYAFNESLFNLDERALKQHFARFLLHQNSKINGNFYIDRAKKTLSIEWTLFACAIFSIRSAHHIWRKKNSRCKREIESKNLYEIVADSTVNKKPSELVNT